MLILITLLLLVGAATLAQRRCQTAEPARRACRRAVRMTRVALGEYSLRSVMEAMLDAMFDSALPSVTRSYLPNVVTFGLHPEDVRRWGAYFPQLAEELSATIVAELDRRSGIELAGPLEVRIVADESAREGRPTFHGRIRSAPAARPAQANRPGCPAATRVAPTRPMPTGTAGAEPSHVHRAADDSSRPQWGLEIVDEGASRFVPLTDELLIGRDREATVRLADGGVSRRHAQVTLLDGDVTVTDLGSSNGTFVNGERIATGMLADGDRLRFGTGPEARVVRCAA